MVNERTYVLYLLVSELVKGVYVLQSVGFELEECIADMIFFLQHTWFDSKKLLIVP